MEIIKKQSFRTAVSCIQWLLAATRSFSLRLLQNHPGRQMRTGGRSYTRTIRRELKAASNGRRLFFFLSLPFYLDSFIPFPFPSRARTGNAVPDDLPGVKEADGGGGAAVVLLLFQLQQSSASPLPFSRHLCWPCGASFLGTKRGEREGGATMVTMQCIYLHPPSVCTDYYVAR